MWTNRKRHKRKESTGEIHNNTVGGYNGDTQQHCGGGTGEIHNNTVGGGALHSGSYPSKVPGRPM